MVCSNSPKNDVFIAATRPARPAPAPWSGDSAPESNRATSSGAEPFKLVLHTLLRYSLSGEQQEQEEIAWRL
jgi:hypothetical protein